MELNYMYYDWLLFVFFSQIDSFTLHTIDVKAGDTLYLYTDDTLISLADQKAKNLSIKN